MTATLVTGASGSIGSSVVRLLRDTGATVRAFVRDAGKAATVLGEDVDLVVGQFGDPETLQPALEGTDRVFLACPNDPRQFEYETNVIEAAARAGVNRLVKLSANGAHPGSPLAFWDAQGRIEQHLDASGIQAVVLRPNFYMTNLLASAEVIKQTGRLFLPADEARVAMIDPRDVAAAAVAALDGAGDNRQRYVLTGPEPITFTAVADALSAAVGYDVQFVSVPDEAAHSAMTQAGMPPFIAENLIRLFGFLRQGAQEATTDDVRNLTGRAPGSFAQFATAHAPVFTR